MPPTAHIVLLFKKIYFGGVNTEPLMTIRSFAVSGLEILTMNQLPSQGEYRS